MAKIEINDNTKPATLHDLEAQLDKEPAVSDGPPHPRESGGSAPEVEETQDTDPISDAELQDAVAAAEETDNGEAERPLKEKSLHLEANPDAPKTPFWKRKKFWLLTLAVLVVALALAWFIRPSRLFLVNTLGLRAELTVTTATMPETGQKSSLLKKVEIDIDGAKVTTNDQGEARAKVHYGTVTVTAKKGGYSDATQTTLVDFDPFFYLLGGRQQDQAARTVGLQLKVVGVALKFAAKDWLTDGPVTTGTFSVGDTVAKSGDDGTVSLTLPATDDKTVKVKAAFGGSYTDKEFEIKLDGSDQTVIFVPAGREYFASNRANGLAVYSSDIDGGNVAEVVPTSPHETAAMTVAVSPSGKYAALASTREVKKDTQGNQLQQLYVIDLATNKLTSTDQALWFNFVDWSGDTLVYIAGELQDKTSETTQRLASLNTTNSKRTNLGTATYYDAVRVALSNVVYQVGYGQNQEGFANSPELRVVPVGGGTEKHLGNQVQHIAQPELERLAYQTADGTWHEYNLNNAQSKNTSAPSNPGRAFMATPTADGQTRLVVDLVDGRPTLVSKSVANGQEKQSFADANIRGPIRLVGNVVVFRMGSADYALSLGGGTPKKITDVTVSLSAFPRPTAYFVFF